MTAPFRALQLAAIAALVGGYLITPPWDISDERQTTEEHALDPNGSEVCVEGYAGAVPRPVGD